MISKIKNLGFAGGGFYGIALVAALKELESYEEYFQVEHVSGVSVGSMIAALYAVGYSADELVKIMFEIDFDNLIRDNYFTYYKLYTKYGMYEANGLENKIEQLICNKTHIKNCTFKQIDIDLTIIATNLNYQSPRFFNKHLTPTMPISRAVRMSIGYPMIITPILFEGDLYGDGGEFMNYPITIYNNLDETLGITFAAHNENNDGTLKHRIDISDIYSYIKSVGSTITRATYVSQITPEHIDRSIVINISEEINSMQFNLTPEQKKSIYDCGVQSTKIQFEKIIGIN